MFDSERAQKHLEIEKGVCYTENAGRPRSGGTPAAQDGKPVQQPVQGGTPAQQPVQDGTPAQQSVQDGTPVQQSTQDGKSEKSDG